MQKIYKVQKSTKKAAALPAMLSLISESVTRRGKLLEIFLTVQIQRHPPKGSADLPGHLGASDGPYSCWVTLGWDKPVVVPRGPV